MVEDFGLPSGEMGSDSPEELFNWSWPGLKRWLGIAAILIFIGHLVYQLSKSQHPSAELDDVDHMILISLDLRDFLTPEEISRVILSIECEQSDFAQKNLLALIGKCLHGLIAKKLIKYVHGKGYSSTQAGKLEITKIANWRQIRNEIELCMKNVHGKAKNE